MALGPKLAAARIAPGVPAAASRLRVRDRILADRFDDVALALEDLERETGGGVPCCFIHDDGWVNLFIFLWFFASEKEEGKSWRKNPPAEREYNVPI